MHTACGFSCLETKNSCPGCVSHPDTVLFLSFSLKQNSVKEFWSLCPHFLLLFSLEPSIQAHQEFHIAKLFHPPLTWPSHTVNEVSHAVIETSSSPVFQNTILSWIFLISHWLLFLSLHCYFPKPCFPPDVGVLQSSGLCLPSLSCGLSDLIPFPGINYHLHAGESHPFISNRKLPWTSVSCVGSCPLDISTSVASKSLHPQHVQNQIPIFIHPSPSLLLLQSSQ